MTGELDRLREVVESLEVPVVGSVLVEAIALADRLEARIAAAVAEFDKAALWELDGATSMVAWLRRQARMAGGRAKRVAATAGRTAELPVTAAAWADGVLSSDQVQAIKANVSDLTVEQLAVDEAELVPFLAPLSVHHTSVAMGHWKRLAEASLPDGTLPEQPPCSLHHSQTLDGRWEGTWSLDAEGGAVVDTAIRLASSDDGEGEPLRPPAERRADALVDVCRWFLEHQTDHAGGRHRPHLNLVVRVDEHHGLHGELADGTVLPDDTVERLACDCAFHRVTVGGDGSILDYGRATRSVPANLFNALVVRDRGCRMAGCDRPASWCHAHHVQPWEHGGSTSLDNLVLLCSRHHTLLHKRRWHAKLLPDGTYEVTLPDGRVVTSHPPGTLLGAAA